MNPDEERNSDLAAFVLARAFKFDFLVRSVTIRLRHEECPVEVDLLGFKVRDEGFSISLFETKVGTEYFGKRKRLRSQMRARAKYDLFDEEWIIVDSPAAAIDFHSLYGIISLDPRSSARHFSIKELAPKRTPNLGSRHREYIERIGRKFRSLQVEQNLQQGLVFLRCPGCGHQNASYYPYTLPPVAEFDKDGHAPFCSIGDHFSKQYKSEMICIDIYQQNTFRSSIIDAPISWK